MVLVNLLFNMKILLKNATVLEHKSPFHTKTVDILIVDGKIKELYPEIFFAHSKYPYIAIQHLVKTYWLQYLI